MTRRDTKIAGLLKLGRNGAFRARDLASGGIPRSYLRRLCERGLLEQLGRGVYARPDRDVTELTDLAHVTRRVPHATICLISALQLHELTTQVPHAVWMMIARNARAPKLAHPPVEVVRASGDALVYGVESRRVEGVTLKVTTPAKTVSDCFRYRNRVGLDVALEALREYLRERRGTIDALVRAAQVDRIYGVMRPYMEALVM